MSAMARRHRSEQRRLLGLRRAVRMSWSTEVAEELQQRFADVMTREPELSPASILAAVERGLRRVHKDAR